MASAQNDPAGIFPAEIFPHISRGTGAIKGTVPGGAGLERPPPVSYYLARLPEESFLTPIVNALTIYDEIRHWPTVGASVTSPRGANRPLTIRMDGENPSANCS